MTAHVMHPRPARRMTAADAGFLYLERPHAPLNVGCLVSLEGGLSPDVLVRRIEARLPRLRRYAQRVVPAPLSLAHPTWEDDPEFDPARHVHRHRTSGLGERALCAVLEELMASPLERDRPLWEAHLIDGMAGAGTALLLKVHHCMVDGVAGASLLEVLLDEKPRARREAPASRFSAQDPSRRAPLRAAQALGVSLATPLRGAAATLGALLDPGRSAAALRGAGEWAARAIRGEAHPLPWNAPLGPRRSIAFTRLPLDDARRIRTAQACTVNDVVLTALAGGLRRYLQASGLRDQPDRLTAFVPVSLRAPGEAPLGNRFSALRVPLALGPAAELDRLAAISTTTERLKARRAFAGLWALLSAVEFLPAPLLAHAARRAPLPVIAHLLATNVPGPRGPRWLAGRKVGALHPIAPIADGMGLSVAVFSYAGWLHVGLHGDAGRVHDLEKLRTGIEEAFAALRARC